MSAVGERVAEDIRALADAGCTEAALDLAARVTDGKGWAYLKGVLRRLEREGWRVPDQPTARPDSEYGHLFGGPLTIPESWEEKS